MNKKDNLITKFREFWGLLSPREQSDLWRIMTALRGEDKGKSFLKALTTSRIRGELLGSNCGQIKFNSWIALNPTQANILTYESYSIGRVRKYMEGASFHWLGHLQGAIRALNKYRLKKNMRDLQKFLNY